MLQNNWRWLEIVALGERGGRITILRWRSEQEHFFLKKMQDYDLHVRYFGKIPKYRGL